MPKISPYIENAKKISYAKETDDNCYEILVDCSAGSNPYGFSKVVSDEAKRLPEMIREFNEYSHGIGLKQAIVEFWSPYVELGINRIVFCDGTIGGIYFINTLFARQGAKVLGICPQFSDYPLHARLLGFDYKGISLLMEEGYKWKVEAFLPHITPELSLIYLDTPNNPTGQIIPLSDIKLILERAKEFDVCVIVDEAYGDYFDLSLSAATLLNEYDNLIVLRTFSKGLGLAGLHAGYILVSEYLHSNFDKITNPYIIPEPSRILAKAALSDKGFIKKCRAEFAESQAIIRNNLGAKLHLAQTFDECPLMLLWHDDTVINLAVEFAKNGVKVYSGTDFETLGANAVRLRMPHRNQMDALVAALEKIK